MTLLSWSNLSSSSAPSARAFVQTWVIIQHLKDTEKKKETLEKYENTVQPLKYILYCKPENFNL